MGLRRTSTGESLLLMRIKRRLHLLSRPYSRRTPVRRAAGALPSSPSDVCLFISYAPTGRFSRHVADHMARLADAGFAVVAIAAMDDPDLPVDPATCPAAALVLKRRNSGFDFGAWAAALDATPALWRARRILFVNDSVYALLGPAYDAMLNWIARSEADVLALAESRQRGRHFQSYVFCLTRRALTSRTTRSFWRNLRDFDDKNDVINYYETTQLKRMEAAGLHVAIRHRLAARLPRNPTIALWRELIADGFPFLKVQLLRDAAEAAEVAGWPEAAAAVGADLGPIERHLEEVAPHGPALAALRAWRVRNGGGAEGVGG